MTEAAVYFAQAYLTPHAIAISPRLETITRFLWSLVNKTELAEGFMDEPDVLSRKSKQAYGQSDSSRQDNPSDRTRSRLFEYQTNVHQQ